MARNIDPGPGYRLLDLGELIEATDEVFNGGGWSQTQAGGCPYKFGTYRRKIKTMNTVTVEGKSKLVKPIEMEVGQIGRVENDRWCVRMHDRICYLEDGGYDWATNSDIFVDVAPKGTRLTLTVGDK